MIDFIQSVLGLITAGVSLVIAVLALIGAVRKRGEPGPTIVPKKPRLWKQRLWLSLGIVLLIVGGGILIFRSFYPSPAVAIPSPSDSLEVIAEGQSVWFPISGTSSHVFSDNSLKVYVLVNSGTEWHIQRQASLTPDGYWTLQRAWIGDATAPIREKSTLRIMAVVSRQHRTQDEKVQDPRQLEPKAMSSPVAVPVQKVHAGKPE